MKSKCNFTEWYQSNFPREPVPADLSTCFRHHGQRLALRLLYHHGKERKYHKKSDENKEILAIRDKITTKKSQNSTRMAFCFVDRLSRNQICNPAIYLETTDSGLLYRIF